MNAIRQISVTKVLARTYVDANGIKPLQVVELTSDSELLISPFTMETAATVFIDGIVFAVAVKPTDIPQIENELQLILNDSLNPALLQEYLRLRNISPGFNKCPAPIFLYEAYSA